MRWRLQSPVLGSAGPARRSSSLISFCYSRSLDATRTICCSQRAHHGTSVLSTSIVSARVFSSEVSPPTHLALMKTRKTKPHQIEQRRRCIGSMHRTSRHPKISATESLTTLQPYSPVARNKLRNQALWRATPREHPKSQ